MGTRFRVDETPTTFWIKSVGVQYKWGQGQWTEYYNEHFCRDFKTLRDAACAGEGEASKMSSGHTAEKAIAVFVVDELGLGGDIVRSVPMQVVLS